MADLRALVSVLSAGPADNRLATLGMKPDGFSPQQFMGDFDRMSPGDKRVIDPTLRQALERIAGVSKSFERSGYAPAMFPVALVTAVLGRAAMQQVLTTPETAWAMATWAESYGAFLEDAAPDAARLEAACQLFARALGDPSLARVLFDTARRAGGR